LLIVILAAVGTIVSVFIGYRQVSNAPDLLLSSIKEGANLSLGKIRQTATRDGIKEWSLEADSANYREADNKVDLKNLSVIYFLEDDREVYLKADQGILLTDTNDIEFSGNVVIRNEAYQMTTEHHNEEAIFLGALEKRTPEERATFLEEECGEDAALRSSVEQLLEAHDNPVALIDEGYAASMRAWMSRTFRARPLVATSCCN